jgi:hypothetical protein
MKTTLYEALGISPTASDEDVRASLRRLIRKYYAKTRDGHGNVEEALRFINHASRILGDPERRAQYDRELAESSGAAEPEVPHVVGNAMMEGGEVTDVMAPTAEPDPDDLLETGLDADEEEDLPPGPRSLHHPGLTERVAAFGRSTAVTVGMCVLFAAFIAAAILFVTPEDAVIVAKQVLVWLTLALVSLTAIYGIVHGIGWARRHRATHIPTLAPQTDLAILNWRRERSVFLGPRQPEEDASWIFQLRMAELERAKAGRTSEPRPWNRLAARLFDYAIWGLILALLFSELELFGVMPEGVGYWLGHPLIAPMIIAATWVPVEALLIVALATTPGKWLFGCYIQFSISDAYAERSTKAQLSRSLRRAFRVWWQGMGCGVPVLSPVLVAIAYEKLIENEETAWDFAQDCLVTHGPPGVLNVVTGVCGLAAMLWLYGVAWHKPMADSIEWAGSSIVAALPSPQSLVPGGFFGDAGLIGGLRTGPVKADSASAPGSAAERAAPPATGEATSPSAPLDPEVAAQFAERRARIAVLKAEGPRMLQAGNYRRAVELCRGWADLDLANADAWRCLGRAHQALGEHREAIAAFRKAKQHDPFDGTLDAAIEKSEQGIVSDFRGRYYRK